MKHIIYVIIVILPLLSGCYKERGKIDYQLTFTFSQGGYVNVKALLYEKKNSKHTDGDSRQLLLNNPGSTIANLSFDNEEVDHVVFLNSNAAFYATIPVEQLIVSDKSFIPGVANPKIRGVFELEGTHKNKFRHYEVAAGQFRFYWTNAEEFGLEDQEYTGTWTMDKKK